MNKQAYGLKDLLGDALAASGAGARGYVNTLSRDNQAVLDTHATQTLRLENAKKELARAHAERMNWQAAPGAYDAALRAAAEAREGHRISGKYAPEAEALRKQIDGSTPALLAGSALSGAVPVGDHYISTPVMTLAGSLGGEALSRMLSPYGSPMRHGLASAGGALLGRLALRGYDALQGSSDPTQDLRKKISSYDAGAFAALEKLSVDFTALNPLSWSQYTAENKDAIQAALKGTAQATWDRVARGARAARDAVYSGARAVNDAAERGVGYMRRNGDSIARGLLGLGLLGGGAYAVHHVLNTEDEMDRPIPRRDSDVYDPTELQNGVF